MLKMPLFVYRIIRYEYWPSWVFYLPIMSYWMYLSIRMRSLTFFTLANPGIELGGFFGESKSAILSKIHPDFLPKQCMVETQNVDEVLQQLVSVGIAFPFIAKPDIGERGTSVTKVTSVQELTEYMQLVKGARFMIQEFLDYSEEFGVFYSRLPNEKTGKITSLTGKVFLAVTGDGKQTIAELMEQSVRARFQLPRFLLEQPERMKQIIPAGEKVVLEPIGNHCRGTEFVNANQHITAELTALFDEIAVPIDGFFYGRFDIKVRSIEDLRVGKTIKIMELNGVSSEPGHIYDTRMSLIRAYYDVTRHWKELAKIAQQNRKDGVEKIRFSAIVRLYVRHVLMGKPLTPQNKTEGN